MRLWLLKPVEGLPNDDNPWIPWYDKAFGHVVRAETEQEARRLANEAGGEESGPRRESFYFSNDFHGGEVWLHQKYTTCVELTPDGQAEVIMSDVHNA